MKTFFFPHLRALIALLALTLGLAACGPILTATIDSGCRPGSLAGDCLGTSVPAAPTAAPLAAGRALAATTAPAATVAPPTVTPGQAQNSGQVLGTLEIHGVDLGFKPTNLNVEQPGRYTITFTNDGAIPHDVTFPNGAKLVANPKETKTADVDVPPSGLSFICSIPGHADAGMKGAISVGGNTASSHNAAAHLRRAT
jgi:plastocyanin